MKNSNILKIGRGQTMAFILCFIESLRVKQILGAASIHRIFYFMIKTYKIEGLDLDFKKRAIGVYSNRLKKYINLLQQSNYINKKGGSNILTYNTHVHFFVNNKGLIYYKKILSKYKRRYIKHIARSMDKYNDLLPKEIYYIYKDVWDTSKIYYFFLILFHYIMKKSSKFYYYHRFEKKYNKKDRRNRFNKI